jgi:hypothetical protein
MRMRWAGNVARMGAKNAHRIFSRYWKRGKFTALKILMKINKAKIMCGFNTWRKIL